jgi:hypothetical protein
LQRVCRSREAAFDRRRGCVSPSSALLGAPAARDSERVDARMESREASEESRRRRNRFRRGREIERAERRGSRDPAQRHALEAVASATKLARAWWVQSVRRHSSLDPGCRSTMPACRRSQRITGAASVRVCVEQPCRVLSLKQWRGRCASASAQELMRCRRRHGAAGKEWVTHL